MESCRKQAFFCSQRDSANGLCVTAKLGDNDRAMQTEPSQTTRQVKSRTDVNLANGLLTPVEWPMTGREIKDGCKSSPGSGQSKENKGMSHYTGLGNRRRPAMWHTIPDKSPTTLDHKKGAFPKQRKVKPKLGTSRYKAKASRERWRAITRRGHNRKRQGVKNDATANQEKPYYKQWV